jgi:hypothetical protein
MVDVKEITKSGKERREALERKKVLLGLARDIGFESKMFALEFKNNTKEPLRYYLWMRELELWLTGKYPIYFKYNYTLSEPEQLELLLIQRFETVNAWTR